MSLSERIQDVQNAAVRRAFVDRASRWTGLALLGAGSLALLTRFAFEADARDAAWWLAAVALAPALAWVTARRGRPSARVAAAWLDCQAGGGGALVTATELPDERWSARTDTALAHAAQPAAPEARAAFGRVVGGAAFVALALLVPVERLAAQPGPRPEMFELAAEDLREKLEALEEEVTFEPEVAEELDEALERLDEEVASAVDPEATFEALDNLEARLEEEATEALDAASRAAEALAEAEARAGAGLPTDEALQSALEALDAAGLEGAFSDLPESLDLGELGLGPDGVEWPEGLELDPELARELSEELRKALAEKLKALADAGLLSAADFSNLGKLEPLDAEALAALEAALKAGEP